MTTIEAIAIIVMVFIVIAAWLGLKDTIRMYRGSRPRWHTYKKVGDTWTRTDS